MRKKEHSRNLSTSERIKRLARVSDLMSEGLSNADIMAELSISETALNNCKKDLAELRALKLTPHEISIKRAEIFFEFNEIVTEAKNILKDTKESGKVDDSRKILLLWKEIVEAKANLFGLGADSARTVVQNTQLIQNNTIPALEMNSDLDYAEIIKREHEKIVSKKYEENCKTPTIEYVEEVYNE